jgi:hypothetical protein
MTANLTPGAEWAFRARHDGKPLQTLQVLLQRIAWSARNGDEGMANRRTKTGEENDGMSD